VLPCIRGGGQFRRSGTGASPRKRGKKLKGSTPAWEKGNTGYRGGKRGGYIDSVQRSRVKEGEVASLTGEKVRRDNRRIGKRARFSPLCTRQKKGGGVQKNNGVGSGLSVRAGSTDVRNN